MENTFKKNGIYLGLYFSLALLVCFLVELFHFEWNAIFNYKSNQFIFASLWILTVIIAIAFILKKVGINYETFGAYCFIFGPFAFSFGLIFSLLVGSHKVSFLERNYIATAGTTEELNSNEDGTNTYYTNTFVFNKNDNAAKTEIEKLDEEYSEGSSTTEFIFWQTALANGYEPKNINSYNCCENSSQKLELYLTVGPLTLVECLINAAPPAFFLLVIPLLGLLFKKRLFFNDIHDLRRIFKKMK